MTTNRLTCGSAEIIGDEVNSSVCGVGSQQRCVVELLRHLSVGIVDITAGRALFRVGQDPYRW